MATQTETKPEVNVIANAKVIEALKEQLQAETQAEGKIMATRHIISSEAKRLGYDRKQCSLMVRLSWRRAKGLPANADEAEIVKFDKAEASNVTNIMLLAWPKEEKNAVELEKILQFNKANPAKHLRVGLRNAYHVARGNMSADDAINRVPQVRAPRGKSNPNGLVSSAPATERFADAIAGLRQAFLKEEKPLSLAEMRKIALAGLADTVAK